MHNKMDQKRNVHTKYIECAETLPLWHTDKNDNKSYNDNIAMQKIGVQHIICWYMIFRFILFV